MKRPHIRSVFLVSASAAVDMLKYPADLVTFFLMAYRSLLTEWGRGSISVALLVRKQVFFTAMLGFPVIAVAALSVGALAFTNAIGQLPSLGAGAHVSTLTNSILLKELAPFLTALIVIARSGTAIATELGTMKVQRETDFLVSQGIDIWYFVVFPRIQGMILSMLMLVLFFDLLAFIGGYSVAAVIVPGTSEYPMVMFLKEIKIDHVLISALKAVCFGAVIGTVSTYNGLQPERSSTEVPQSAIRGVVHSLALCILVNFFVSIYV